MRKFTLILVAISLFLNTVAFAETENITVKDIVGEENASSDLLDTESFYKKIDALDTSVFGQLKWEVPVAEDRIKLINFEYAALCYDFKSLGAGQDYKLTIPEFESGYSGSITEEFNRAFGDISIDLTTNNIPKDWTMENIMSVSTSQRDKISSGFRETESYKTVSNSISIGSVFSEAKKNLSAPQLENSSSAQNRLDKASAQALAEHNYKVNEADKDRLNDANTAMGDLYNSYVNFESSVASNFIDGYTTSENSLNNHKANELFNTINTAWITSTEALED